MSLPKFILHKNRFIVKCHIQQFYCPIKYDKSLFTVHYAIHSGDGPIQYKIL